MKLNPFSKLAVALSLPAFFIAFSTASVQASRPPAETSLTPGHLRLMDDLDRPQDGYCLDILGSGQYIRFDMPITAHNCKPGLYMDEAVVIESDGRIHFPAYGACATAAGINKRALAGAAIMPRACGDHSPFLEADNLQKFTHHPDGRIELKDSNLCLTVGNESDSTPDETHPWRALSLAHCHQATSSHSRCHFAVPK